MGLENVSIHATVTIGKNVSIDPFTVIKKGVVIEDNARISSCVRIEENCVIGSGSFIGHGCVLRPSTVILEDCVIGHLTVFEGSCVVRRGTLIHAQCHITRGADIGENVFIAPFFVGANDPKMCHRRDCLEFEPMAYKIEDGVRIGIGVSVLPNVKIGKNAIIGVGSVVTRDIPENKVVFGNPARVRGMVPVEERL